MTLTLKSLGIDKLTVDQRLELVEAIQESVADDLEKAPLTEAQLRELDRRLADHEANPGAVIPWEQIKAEALARFKKK